MSCQEMKGWVNPNDFSITIKNEKVLQVLSEPVKVKLPTPSVQSWSKIPKYEPVVFDVVGKQNKVVERLCEDVDNAKSKALWDVVLCNKKKDWKRLPRKLKKAYKKREWWAVLKVVQSPQMMAKFCHVGLDIGEGNDFCTKFMLEINPEFGTVKLINYASIN